MRRPVESALEDVLEIVDHASAREQRAISEKLRRGQTGGRFWKSISNGWNRMLFGQEQALNDGEDNTRNLSWLIPFFISLVLAGTAFYWINIQQRINHAPVLTSPQPEIELSSSRWVVKVLDRTTSEPVETAHVTAFVIGYEQMPPSARDFRLFVKQVAPGRFEVSPYSRLRRRAGETFRGIYLYVDAEGYWSFERRFPVNQELIEVFLEKKGPIPDRNKDE